MPKVSELPDAAGITDTDYLILLDDADGTPATKRVDALDALSYFSGGEGLEVGTDSSNNSRMVDQERIITIGPWRTAGGTAYLFDQSGFMVLCVSYVAGCTIDQARIWVSVAANSGDKAFYVIYDIDSAGLPTTLLHSFEFTIGTSTGYVASASGLGVTIEPGFRWVGVWVPTANTGTALRILGGVPEIATLGSGGSLNNNIYRVLVSGATPPASITSIVFNTAGTALALTGGEAPFLFGRDA